MKKLICVILAALLCMTMLMACGGSGSDQTTPAATSAEQTTAEKTEASTAEKTTEAPTTTTEEAKEEPYTAYFAYYVATDNWPHQDQVKEHIREITLRDLNIDCQILPFTFSTFAAQVPMMLASKEQLDVFNAGSPDEYYEAGYIIDLLPYVDILKEAMDKCGYDDVMASLHQGHLLALPAQLERTHHYGMFFRTDILNAVGYTDADINHGDYAQLGEILAAVHEKYPEMVGMGGAYSGTPPQNTQHTDPMGNYAYGVLDNYGQTWEVTNYYESDYFKMSAGYMRDWYLKGYIKGDIAVSSDSAESEIKAGNTFGGCSPMKPDTYATKKDKCGYDMSMFYLREDMMTCYSGAGYAVSGTAKDFTQAARLLNYVFTSREFNDTINWGVEGLDWVEIADNVAGYPEGMDVSNQTYHNSLGWSYPNQRVAHVWQGNDPEMYTRIYPEAEKAAWRSYAFGFNWDATKYLDNLGALKNIVEEYIYGISAGAVDPEEKIPEFNKKLYDSGLQDIMDDKQAQLDAWRAENGK